MQGKIHWHYVSRVRFSQWRPDVMSNGIDPEEECPRIAQCEHTCSFAMESRRKDEGHSPSACALVHGENWMAWPTCTKDESKRTSRDYESKHNTHSNTWHPQHSSHTQSHPVKTFSVASHPFSSACSSFPFRHHQSPCLHPAMES